MKKILIIAGIVCFFTSKLYAQVGTTGNAPQKSAALDLNETNVTDNNKGLLLPKLSLADNKDVSRIAGGQPAQGLIIYNINNITSDNLSGEGFYYWENAMWNKLIAPPDFADLVSKQWTLKGNSNTTAATNFIGTTDAQAFAMKTNNQLRVSIDGSTGNVGVNTINPDPSAILDINGSNKALKLTAVPLTGPTDVTTVPGPQAGMMVYNSNTRVINFYDGTRWMQVISANPGVITPRLVGLAKCSVTRDDPSTPSQNVFFDNLMYNPENAFSGDVNAGTLYTVQKTALHQVLVNLTAKEAADASLPVGTKWTLQIYKNSTVIAALDASVASGASAIAFAIDNFSAGDQISVKLLVAQSYYANLTRITVYRFE